MRRVAISALLLLFVMSACSGPKRPSVAATPLPILRVAKTAATATPPPAGIAATPPELPAPTLRPTAGLTVSPEPTVVPAMVRAVTPTGTPLPYMGRDALDRWHRRLAAIRAGAPYAQATIALVGDSWVDGDIILGYHLRQDLQAKYGDGGPGFVEFGGEGIAKGPPLGQNVVYERGGSWTIHDAFSDPRGRGVDLADVSSIDTSTPATISISGEFADLILHYVKQPGGGSFRWQADGGPWTEVPTAGPAFALETAHVGGLAAARHTVKIMVSSAGKTGVRLAGADLRKRGNGVRVDRIGMNGAGAVDYVRADAGLWRAALSALDPDLVIVLLGTNDEARERLPSQYRDDMESILARIQEAVPQAGILLLAPGDNNLKALGKVPLGIGEYNAELRALASASDLAFLDSLKVLGSFDDARARGLYHDDVHLNEDGGRLLARYLLDNLLELP